MVELLNVVASWPSLLLVVVVFGFAPGFCLRLIVLAYPSSDPRRAELIAELYVVPRIQRPLWVAEQLEVALFEGLGHRLSAAIRWFARRGAQALIYGLQPRLKRRAEERRKLNEEWSRIRTARRWDECPRCTVEERECWELTGWLRPSRSVGCGRSTVRC